MYLFIMPSFLKVPEKFIEKTAFKNVIHFYIKIGYDPQLTVNYWPSASVTIRQLTGFAKSFLS
jgi:hypothetical protein